MQASTAAKRHAGPGNLLLPEVNKLSTMASTQLTQWTTAVAYDIGATRCMTHCLVTTQSPQTSHLHYAPKAVSSYPS